MHAGTGTPTHKLWAHTANTNGHRKQVQPLRPASSISCMRRKSERNVWLVPSLISLVCVDQIFVCKFVFIQNFACIYLHTHVCRHARAHTQKFRRIVARRELGEESVLKRSSGRGSGRGSGGGSERGSGRGRVRYSRTYKLVVALWRALSLVKATTR